MRVYFRIPLYGAQREQFREMDGDLWGGSEDLTQPFFSPFSTYILQYYLYQRGFHVRILRILIFQFFPLIAISLQNIVIRIARLVSEYPQKCDAVCQVA